MIARRLTRPAALALTLGLLLTACGSGRVEPKEWAVDVCGSWKQLNSQMQEASTKLQQDMGEPKKAQKAFETYLSSLEKSMRRLETDIEETEVPDVENGEKLCQQMIESVTSVRQAFGRARESASSRDMSDPAEAMKVFADLSKDTKQMLEAKDRVKSPEMKKAFEQTPACDQFPL